MKLVRPVEVYRLKKGKSLYLEPHHTLLQTGDVVSVSNTAEKKRSYTVGEHGNALSRIVVFPVVWYESGRCIDGYIREEFADLVSLC